MELLPMVRFPPGARNFFGRNYTRRARYGQLEIFMARIEFSDARRLLLGRPVRSLEAALLL
jgi:hypothetical protein